MNIGFYDKVQKSALGLRILYTSMRFFVLYRKTQCSSKCIVFFDRIGDFFSLTMLAIYYFQTPLDLSTDKLRQLFILWLRSPILIFYI